MPLLLQQLVPPPPSPPPPLPPPPPPPPPLLLLLLQLQLMTSIMSPRAPTFQTLHCGEKSCAHLAFLARLIHIGTGWRKLLKPNAAPLRCRWLYKPGLQQRLQRSGASGGGCLQWALGQRAGCPGFSPGRAQPSSPSTSCVGMRRGEILLAAMGFLL